MTYNEHLHPLISIIIPVYNREKFITEETIFWGFLIGKDMVPDWSHFWLPKRML